MGLASVDLCDIVDRFEEALPSDVDPKVKSKLHLVSYIHLQANKLICKCLDLADAVQHVS